MRARVPLRRARPAVAARAAVRVKSDLGEMAEEVHDVARRQNDLLGRPPADHGGAAARGLGAAADPSGFGGRGRREQNHHERESADARHRGCRACEDGAGAPRRGGKAASPSVHVASRDLLVLVRSLHFTYKLTSTYS